MEKAEYRQAIYVNIEQAASIADKVWPGWAAHMQEAVKGDFETLTEAFYPHMKERMETDAYWAWFDLALVYPGINEHWVERRNKFRLMKREWSEQIARRLTAT